MIGPIDSYQSIYVAACGQDFPCYKLGIDHEKYCPHCICIINEIKEDIYGTEESNENLPENQ